MFSLFPLMTSFAHQSVVSKLAGLELGMEWDRRGLTAQGRICYFFLELNKNAFLAQKCRTMPPVPLASSKCFTAHLPAKLLHKRAAKCIFIFQYRYSRSS